MKRAAIMLVWMVWLGVLLASRGLAFSAEQKIVVAADGTGTHRTIQTAVDSAHEGAVIEIRAGTYQGPVRIDKPVELRGVSWEKVILTSDAAGDMKQIGERMKERFGPRGPGKNDQSEVDQMLAGFGFPLLKIKGSEGVVISGLKVVNGMKGDKNRLMSFALVEFDRAKATLRDSAVLGGPGNGIALRNGSTVTVTNCLVAAQWGTGIAIGSGDDLVNLAVIVDSEIRNCYHRCITIQSDREVRVERCRISGSAWHGIRYDDCSPLIEGCFIAGSARSGIYASGRTTATVRNNIFWRNGLSAWFANKDIIEGNTFVENSGVSIIARTAPSIRSNLFQNNRIAVTQSSTEGVRPEDALSLEQIEIKGNVFVGNEGIWRGILDEKAGIEEEKGSILEGKGNQDAGFGVIESGKNFQLSEEFREKFHGVGSTVQLVNESKWPLQPEEKAIIPQDSGTRDWRLWRN